MILNNRSFYWLESLESFFKSISNTKVINSRNFITTTITKCKLHSIYYIVLIISSISFFFLVYFYLFRLFTSRTEVVFISTSCLLYEIFKSSHFQSEWSFARGFDDRQPAEEEKSYTHLKCRQVIADNNANVTDLIAH